MYISHFSDISNQTVNEHNRNVAILTSKYASKIGFTNTGKLLGLLHDFGKYSNAFQKYINDIKTHTEDGTLEEYLRNAKTVDHGKCGAMFLYEHFYNGTSTSKTYVEILSIIIAYHHGGLPDFISLNCKYSVPFLTRVCGYKKDIDYISAKENCKVDIDVEKIEKLFNFGLKEYKIFLKNIKNNQEYLFFIILFLYSCLIDADRTDTQCFQDNISIEEIDSFQNYSDFIPCLEDFHNKMVSNSDKTKINTLRNEIYDECVNFSKHKSGCYTLTVPTGGGKTISSFAYALYHQQLYKKDKIVYVLPFTSIIEQNANVFREIIGKKNVLEYHSNIINDNKIILDSLKISYKDSELIQESYKLLTHRWNFPLITTTLVQFLNTPFSKGTQNIRRFHNLCNSVIIFDEIQSLPIKCIGLFGELINFLKDICECTIVLCSATQPAFNKISFQNDVYNRFLLNIDREIISDPTFYYKEFKRVHVINKTIKDGYTEKKLKNFVENIMKKYNNLLIIMNTKKTAEKVYNIFAKDNDYDNVYYLSTNLCPKHRSDIIEQIKKDLHDKKHFICVSTQLIEAGVDISFECVIRNIAGASSIAQSAGRCNRNGENLDGKTYIINIVDEELGSLKDIKDGEDIVSNIYTMNHDIDILSIDAISDYFSKFHSRKDDRLLLYPLNYGVTKNTICEQTLLNKDFRNKAIRNIDFEDGKDICNILTYAYKSIFSEFKVIDDNMISVIVPYKDGKKIITDLFSSKSIKDKMKCLENIQEYTINIHSSKFEELFKKGIIKNTEIANLFVLNLSYYNKKGFVDKPEFENLII